MPLINGTSDICYVTSVTYPPENLACHLNLNELSPTGDLVRLLLRSVMGTEPGVRSVCPTECNVPHQPIDKQGGFMLWFFYRRVGSYCRAVYKCSLKRWPPVPGGLLPTSDHFIYLLHYDPQGGTARFAPCLRGRPV